MKVSTELIKKLREETHAPILEVKKALEESDGNLKKASEMLIKFGFERAEKKKTRVTSSGIVETYIHATKTAGATVVLQSETDFVARTPEFKNLAREIAMQITAMNHQNNDELLDAPWIRDDSKTISDLIDENISFFGENIKIQEFKRFEVGLPARAVEPAQAGEKNG